MKLIKWIAIYVSLLIAVGCEKGDPTDLKEAVRLASLNITSITVEPADGTITTGYSYQFTAIGHRPDGSTTDITSSVVWTSSDEAIATVDSSGLVTTATDGAVTVMVSLSSLSGSTSLTASSDPLDSIAVFADTNTPNDLSVSACKNLQLKAIGTYNGEARDTIPITNNVTWSVQAGSGRFSSSSQGLLYTESDGTIGVQASLDGVDSPTTDVTAINDLNSIEVAPTNATTAINATLQYTATSTYADNSTADITDNTTWTSSDPAVANFNTPESNGLITALALGPTTVTAACGTVPNTGTANLSVTEDVVDEVLFEDEDGQAINPLDTVVGVTTQVILMAYLSDGSSRDVTEDAQWTEFNNTGNIVSVDNTTGDKGRVTALAAGTGVVQATYQQRDYLLIVNVSEP